MQFTMKIVNFKGDKTMEKVKMTWKVYGAEGHRQKVSFEPSVKYDWSIGEDTRIVELQNSDVTGTNDYTVVIITRNSEISCRAEFDAQLSDGIFENSCYGKIELVNIEIV